MSIQNHTNGSDNGNGIVTPSSPLTTAPFPASQKIYVHGVQPGVHVPMREISLSQTKGVNGASSGNNPVIVYDTSGPYTDPSVTIDVRNGLTPLRHSWVLSRQDVEELPDVSSTYGRLRATDPKLAELRFQHIRKPLRAKHGKNVTQLHYARKGIITPEMEFIAIRENQSRHTESEAASQNGHGGGVKQHPGFAWGASIPSGHYARVRARRGCPWPRDHSFEHQPSGKRTDDHRPKLPREDQFQHRQFRRRLFHRRGS